MKENSALTIGYLQLNSFILTNYFIENPNKTYSLSNQPLILIKYHLLKSYEDFLLINSESPKGTFRTNDSFNKENRVTVINERILFDDDGSEYFLGKNKAFPIFMEFFHEKFSNSKISLKNFKVKNPIICINGFHIFSCNNVLFVIKYQFVACT